MNMQDIPVKDQEQPEGEAPPKVFAPRESVPGQPEIGAAVLPEQPIAPSMPAHTIPPAWPNVAPGTPPPWGWQPGPIRVDGPAPRKHNNWPWIVVALVLLCLLIFGGAIAAIGILGITGTTNRTSETRSFNVTSGPTLILNNDTGSIHVSTTTSENMLTVQATKSAGPWTNVSDLQVAYTQNTATNTVSVNVSRLHNSSFFDSLSVDFDVTLPATATLQLKTNTGSIDVNGVSGQMTLTSNTGSLVVNGGTARGVTMLTTNTGSVTFNSAIEQNGAYTFTTNTGSVNVTLPAGSAFHLDASTDTGSINTSFAGIVVQHRQAMGADAHGDVGSSPLASMRLTTNTGSINVYQR